MRREASFDANELRRARYTILVTAGCGVGWIVMNAVAAWWLEKPRLLGLSAAAVAMVVSWVVALRDLRIGKEMRGVLTYVISGLVLAVAMGLFVPELAVLFTLATFVFLAFGLSYASASATSVIVGLTMTAAAVLLYASLGLGLSSGIDPGFLRWVNITGMTMVLATSATSFIALRKTVQARGDRLARAEERYRALLENARDAIGILGTEGQILEANRGWEEMLGFPREKLLGRKLTEFAVATDPPEVAAAPLATIARGDGKVIHVELSCTPVDVGGEQFVLAVGRDVTERLRLEGQLRQSQKMEAVGRLAGGIAHDFNNILSVILSHGGFILEDLPSADPRRDDVEQICEAGRRAADLTRQLLMFSRQQVIEPKVVDLNEVLTEMDKMLRRIVGEDVELVSQEAASLGRVRVDRGSIEQVIMNLVVNARDAMPTGGKLTIETANVDLDEAYASTHLAAQSGPHVMLAVTDTGVGMDEATRLRIFEPFFTTKDRSRGTGLGLSTVLGIVEQSGGSVWVYSEPGKGAAFKVYLPRIDAPAESLSATRLAVSERGTETVLVVDDDDAVRAAACGILRRHGYEVLEACSADEAIVFAQKHPEAIHLLVTDVVMPNVSGPELAKRFAEIRPVTKVICMSGYTDDSIVRHGVLESQIAYLQKPITSASLTAKVREVLDGV